MGAETSFSSVHGLPCCTGRKLVVGINDLETINPTLAAQWHPTKNHPLLPSQVGYKAVTKYWWLGDCGHEWEASVYTRFKGRGCHYCAGIKVLPGFNDLVTQNPVYLKEWHPTKNTVLPTEVSSGSNTVVWWLGTCGHEWEVSVTSRSRFGCPYCAGNKVLAGFNDLGTLAPADIVAQWHPTKNEKTVFEVNGNSHHKAWWLCRKGHEWQSVINSRRLGAGCPKCAATKFVSKAEQEIADFLVALGITVEQSDRMVLGKNQELDIYIPDQKFAVEFNGLYWHSEESGKPVSYHRDKYLAAKAVGVRLVQVWEDDWRDRKSAVQRLLAGELGVIDRLGEVFPEFAAACESLSVSDLSVVPLTARQARLFLEVNHVQGYASGSFFVGLEGRDGVLRAAMTLDETTGSEGRVLNVVRFATFGVVNGGFAVLLKHVVGSFSADSLVVFAENTFDEGSLYESHGFVTDGDVPVGCTFVVDGVRALSSDVSVTDGLPRVWDAGKTRYRFSINT